MPAQSDKHRIMVVDDDADMRLIVRTSLEERFEVLEAHDGLDALEKVDKYEPDLIIMDMMMPLMDGFQACEAIRRKPRFESIQVIFLTGHGSRDNITRSYNVGGNVCLQKPVDPERLLKNVNLAIEQNDLAIRPKQMSLKQIQIVESGGHAPPPKPIEEEFLVTAESLEQEVPQPEAQAEAEEQVQEHTESTGPTTQASRLAERPKPREIKPGATEPQPETPGEETPPAAPRHAPLASRPKHPAPQPDKPANQSNTEQTDQGDPNATPRAMVVEDDNDLVTLMEMALVDNFEVVIAHDGMDAIEKMVRTQPDLLVVDVMMPKMNGYQFIQSVRSNRAFSSVPIIVASAKASPKDREYAKRIGATAFLGKPFQMEDLLGICAAIVARPGFITRTKTHDIETVRRHGDAQDRKNAYTRQELEDSAHRRKKRDDAFDRRGR